MRELYADLPADQFSPKKLKVVRQAFIERDNSRTHVNTCTRRVVAIFRWAAEDEMVPGSVPHALQSVRPLEQGRGNVREGNAVEAVDQETVDATLAELTPIVADMVRLQLASGARPGEICNPACSIWRSFARPFSSASTALAIAVIPDTPRKVNSIAHVFH